MVFGASSTFFVAAELGEANKQEMCGIALIVSGVLIDISCLSLDLTCPPRKTEDVSSKMGTICAFVIVKRCFILNLEGFLFDVVAKFCLCTNFFILLFFFEFFGSHLGALL